MFGDFSQEETNHIRDLSEGISEELRERSFMDAFKAPVSNMEVNNFDREMEEDDQFSIHLQNEGSIDSDILNVSVNNNEGTGSGSKQPEVYHSIPHISIDHAGVVPETPKQQRSRRTLKDFNFISTSKSEGNVPNQGEVRVTVSSAGRSISKTNTGRSTENALGLFLAPSESDEDQTTVLNVNERFNFSRPTYVSMNDNATPGTSTVRDNP